MPRKTVSKTEKPEVKEAIRAIAKQKHEREEALQRIMTILSEFFDAGFVVVTWSENGKTFKMDAGMGNQFAIDGLLEDVMEERAELNDDEGEEWKKA